MPTQCWSASEITKRKQQVVNATFFKLQEGSGGSVKNNPQTGDTADSKLLDIVQGSRTAYYRTQEGHLESDVPCSCITTIVEDTIIISNYIVGIIAGSLYYNDGYGNLVGLNDNTSIKWKYSKNGSSSCIPFLGSSGNVYSGTNNGNIYAVNSLTGLIIWSANPIEGIIRGVFEYNGKVYVSINKSDNKAYLYVYNTNGILINYIQLNGVILGPVRNDSIGNLYFQFLEFVSTDGINNTYNEQCIQVSGDLSSGTTNITGNIKQDIINVDIPFALLYPVIDDASGNVYIQFKEYVYSYKLNGRVKNWEFNNRVQLSDIILSPLFDGTYIYTVISENNMNRLNKDATNIIQSSDSIQTTISIDMDNNYIYTYNINNELIAIDKTTMYTVNTGFINNNIYSTILSKDKLRLYTIINDTQVIEVNKATLQPL